MASKRRATDRAVPYVVGCLIAVSVGWLLNRIDRNHSSEINTCHQVQKLSGAIWTTLQRDLQTLGRKGTAGYAYYRVHPDELAAAKLQGQQQLVTFKPRAC